MDAYRFDPGKENYRKALAAQPVFLEQLAKIFNSVAGSPVNGVGIGLGKNGFDFILKANLERQPTKEEAALLPQEVQGVRVKYEFTGPVTAA